MRELIDLIEMEKRKMLEARNVKEIKRIQKRIEVLRKMALLEKAK